MPLVQVLNPYRAMLAVLYPQTEQLTGVVRVSSLVYIAARLTFAAALVAFGTWKLRVWNPGSNEPRELREGAEVEAIEELIEVAEEPAQATAAVGRATVGAGLTGAHGAGSPADFAAEATWPLPHGSPAGFRHQRQSARPASRCRRPGCTSRDEPTGVLRRRPSRIATRGPTRSCGASSMTRAYGAKPLIIKGCYVLLFALGMSFFFQLGQGMEDPLETGLALIPIGLTILSLILVNAQGVTALTSERDTGASICCWCRSSVPRNSSTASSMAASITSKEMIALPVLTAIAMGFLGILTGENLVLFLIDFLLLCHFAAMLGLHAAITYTSSRAAVAHSLGTIFFLMVGILICAFLIMLNNQEVARQLLSFMIFIGAGSVALFGPLGARNPSRAIALGLAADAVLDVLLHHQPAQR